MSAPVAIAVVSHDSADDLAACLATVGSLDPPAAELIVVDCASRDDSVEVARRAWPTAFERKVVALGENRGFAGGTNVAIAESKSPWLLTLNPDAAPEPDFLGRLLERADDPRAGRVGAIAGRLSRPGQPVRLDACGMRLARAWRHFDRGAGELDRGQYARAERVFGATGAASLWRRQALDDVALDGQAFDESFHSYREDAELCFRLRERGWEVIYEPRARALHRRRVVPERRSLLPAAINRLSLRNRYLLRSGHQSFANFVATLPWTLARDLGALGWVIARERGSLGVYGELWRARRELVQRRRRLFQRRTAPPGSVERWFAVEGEPL